MTNPTHTLVNRMRMFSSRMVIHSPVFCAVPIIRRFHHTCIPSPDGTRLLITGGRETNVWSSPALLATGMPDEFGSSTYVEAEEETLPPSAYTLNIETAKLTPGLPGSALSPKDTCKTPSGIPEPPLSWASLEVSTPRGIVERLPNMLYPSKPVPPS